MAFMNSIIHEQNTPANRGQEVTPVIVLTSEQPLVAPVLLPDTDFYRVKDKSCKDLDMEHNTPSHSPVVSRHNSFIHKARLRKEPVTESAANESKPPPVESSPEQNEVDERKRKRDNESTADDEPHRKVRKMDDSMNDANTNSVKDNER